MLQAGQMPGSGDQNQHQNGHKQTSDAMGHEQHAGKSLISDC